MVTFRSLLSIFSFVTLAVSSPVKVRSEYGLKDRHVVPSQWRKIDRAPANHIIHLKIALRQGRFDELEQHLYEGTRASNRLESLQSLSTVGPEAYMNSI